MTIGERIKHYREQKGWSLNKLAFLAEVSPAYISQLENNKSKSPSTDILVKISKTLEISIVDLLKDEKSEQTCENCRFYMDGDCHRFPPVYSGVKEFVTGYNSETYVDYTEERDTFAFPEVDKTKWCGEWQPKI